MISIKDGVISVDMSDSDFITLVWSKWAGYDDGEIDYLWNDLLDEIGEGMEDLTEGILVEENTSFVMPDVIILKKVGKRQWTLDQADEVDMEVFVERLEQEEE